MSRPFVYHLNSWILGSGIGASQKFVRPFPSRIWRDIKEQLDVIVQLMYG